MLSPSKFSCPGLAFWGQLSTPVQPGAGPVELSERGPSSPVKLTASGSTIAQATGAVWPEPGVSQATYRWLSALPASVTLKPCGAQVTSGVGVPSSASGLPPLGPAGSG